jgi:hypothetical protein
MIRGIVIFVSTAENLGAVGLEQASVAVIQWFFDNNVFNV